MRKTTHLRVPAAALKPLSAPLRRPLGRNTLATLKQQSNNAGNELAHSLAFLRIGLHRICARLALDKYNPSGMRCRITSGRRSIGRA